MTDLEKYRQFSEQETTIPLFSKGWWMDAVCKDNWDVILIEENDEIRASLPYYLQQNDTGHEIRKATLTQTNGIWMRYPPDQKYERKLTYEKNLMNVIIDEIEQLGLTKYQQYFHYSFTNWLPFYWRGYSQTTRYTYVIHNTTDLDEVYQNFNSNIRKNIRKAEKSVQVYEGLDIDEFYHLNKLTFERQHLEIPYSFETFSQIDEASRKRNARKILYCMDNEHQIHAAAYFVWDGETVYYLLSGSNPDHRNSQSLTLLIYEGIKLANRLNRKFDFEGSMKKNIEPFFRQFGAEQMPYHNIYKVF